MEFQQILFLVILAVTLGLFISEKLRIDLVALLALLALTLTGILGPKDALAGFASEPAIIVAAVFVISGGLAATGITEHIGAWIGLQPAQMPAGTEDSWILVQYVHSTNSGTLGLSRYVPSLC